MSHFDDWDFLFWGDSPTTIAGIVVFCLLLAGVGFYACSADDASARKCAEHGEKYVDSRESYTLCERPDGTVVRR